MAKLIYTNSRGDSIELGQSAPFFITKIEGFSDVENNISTIKSPNQDGESVVSENLDPRYIVIQGEYYFKDKQEGRNKLIKIFNPKLSGKLKYINGNMVREINCKAERTPIISSTNKRTIPYLINLFASNPFWLDEFDISKEIVTWIGGMKFPFRLPTTFAMAGEKIINVVNDGDVETPVKVEIYGPAINPKLIKRETGEYIRIKKELTAGDVITITTEFGNKRVELNGVNAFNLLDLPASTFFNLDVGDNVISLITEDVTSNANVKISYRNRYLGV